MATPRPLSSIVVPIDFSEGSELALARALHLPVGPKTKLTLLHVLPDDIPGVLRKQAIAEAERGLEKVLGRLHRAAEEHGLAPSQFVADVVEGDAATQILKRARTVEADLVCMGRHGKRPVVDLFIGSTALKVVKRGDVPVLVVKHPAQARYRTVLVALDVSQKDGRVLRGAAAILDPAVRVSALTVAAVPFEGYVELTGAQVTTYREQARKAATLALREMLKKSPLRVSPKVLLGDARVLVLDEAQTMGAELVVVGASTRKGLERLLVGSVAQWVLEKARCDVFVTRG
jgi:nucleotide-binding universal stress UspA family protein